MDFVHNVGDVYIVIGRDVHGKRFRQTYSNPRWALAINLYRGRVYQKLASTGKRRLVKSVYN